MSRARVRLAAAFAGLAAGLAPAAALADVQIYSYEPASPATRALAASGLSFEFERHPFGGLTIHRIIQTGDRGSADLLGGSESALGAGGLEGALGGARRAGRLYRIGPERDGAAFVNAVCPGAEQAWLVIGELKRFKDLKVQAVGRDPGAPASRLCATLELSFHNAWVLPQRNPPRVRFPRNGPRPG